MQPTDRQLLFGVLALQLDFISVDQFAEVCTVWASRKDRSLPDLLAERGWLKPQDRSDIDRLVARKLQRHGGDVAASLREAGADARVMASLASISDEGIHRSLGPTPPPHGLAVIATRDFEPDGRDRYTLSHVHAEGGIGRVWLARDNSLRRDVALKELRPDRSTNEANWPRFLREARVTGQLEHPGIVPIYEVGQRPDDKAPFYTMRFIRGQTLAEAADQYHSRLKNGEAGPLELRKLLSAFVGVCNAVAYAHSRGVLHRDLKPQNVVLGAFGEVIVLDWGLAKLTGDDDVGPELVDLGSSDDVDPTHMSAKLGTPAYMSPEQASGRIKLVGPQSDMYGLGAILFHILTNEPPFPAPSGKEAMNRVINDPVPRARDKAPTTPAALEAVCVKALAKKPDERYETATALAEEMQRWLADEPVQAHRESLPIRALRLARRHKTFVTAAAVFLVCSTVAFAAIAALIWREQRETDRQLARTNDFATNIVEAADRVSDDVTRLRLSMAQAGVGLLRELRHERPEDANTALTLSRLLQFEATAMRLSRQFDEAEKELKESISTLAPFLERDSANGMVRSVSASAYCNLGIVQMGKGKRSESAASQQRAIDLYDGPAKNDRRAPFHRAIASNELAVAHFGWKSKEEAYESSNKAVDLLKSYLATHQLSDSAKIRLLYCGALSRLAQCLYELHRPTEGFRRLEESEKIISNLLDEHRRNRDVRHFRALIWLRRARAFANDERQPAADTLSTYDKAADLWKELADQWPEHDAYRFMLCQTLSHRAEFRRQQGDVKQAKSDLARADETLKDVPATSQSTVDYHVCRARIASLTTRLALDANDAAQVKVHLASARDAYGALLNIDPDNNMEKGRLEELEAEVRAKGIDFTG